MKVKDKEKKNGKRITVRNEERKRNEIFTESSKIQKLETRWKCRCIKYMHVKMRLNNSKENFIQTKTLK